MGTACCGNKSPVITPEAKYEMPRKKSPPISRENSAMQRFTRVGFSKHDPLILIDGYMDEPLVSLEEALKPFEGKIDQLSHNIQQAKTDCHYPSEHELTRDESAAIYICTMNQGQGNLYDRLQAAWDSGDPSRLKPWFSYLRLFKSALDKLPIAKTEIWQGTSFNEKLKDQLTSKSGTLYSCMCSCSPSMNEIKDHLLKNPAEKILLVGYESVDGRVLTDYTARHSKEIMPFPGVKLNLAKCAVISIKGSLIFHMVGTSDRPLERIEFNIPPSGKHFVCPHSGCGNRCPDDHHAHHCHGFVSLLHICQHHCGPDDTCNNCKKHAGNLRECYSCHRRFCDKCCFK